MIHVRFEGQSMELTEKELGLPPTPPLPDRTILDRLARRLEVSRKRLDNYVVDRRPSGVIVIRPEAVYG